MSFFRHERQCEQALIESEKETIRYTDNTTESERHTTNSASDPLHGTPQTIHPTPCLDDTCHTVRENFRDKSETNIRGSRWYITNFTSDP